MNGQSNWAKLPIRWIHEGGLNKFTDRAIRKMPLGGWPLSDIETDAEVEVEALRNECIAALRLYLALCCKTDFKTGLTTVTYPQLTLLAKMSRAVISRSLKRLELENLIARQPQASKEGTTVRIVGWDDEYSWGKIPKLWLYDGFSERLRLLAEFNYSKASFDALKVFIAILGHRDRYRGGIATLSYDKLSLITGVPRYRVADAITKLYDMDLISFRQGDFRDLDAMLRTNRYLVRGLGSYWPAEDAAEHKASTQLRPSKPTKNALKASRSFMDNGSQ